MQRVRLGHEQRPLSRSGRTPANLNIKGLNLRKGCAKRFRPFT